MTDRGANKELDAADGWKGQLLVCGPHLELELREDDAVVRTADAEAAFRVSATGAAILERLAAPTTVETVVEQVAAEFDVDRRECAAEVERFVTELRRRGLIRTLGRPAPDVGLRRRYLDLLKSALVNLIYPEHELRLAYLENCAEEEPRLARQRALRDIRYDDPQTFAALVEAKRYGRVWQRRVNRDSHTMVGVERLHNLERCAATVFADGVEGDFLEAGVWHGGAAIFLRALQVAYGHRERRTWLADSFAGLPAPTAAADRERDMDLTEERQPWLAASLGAVRENFRTYDLLSENVRFLPGWFAETLPAAPVERLAILRLDADLYSSTRDALDALYDRVEAGGFVVVDDYWGFESCRLAVDEFLAERGVVPAIERVDWTAVFWRKAG